MKRLIKFTLLIFTLIGLFTACYEEKALPINGDFSFNAENFNNPAVVSFTANMSGAETYLWTFEGGTPAQSVERNPKVVFEKTGTFKVSLLAQNTDGTQKTIEKSIVISEEIQIKFDYKITGNTAAPAEVQFVNNTVGGTNFEWTFEGGIPNKSTDKSPIVQFNTGGPKKISLKVGNLFTTKTKDSTLVLDPELVPKFTLIPPSPLFEMEVPISFELKNESVGAQSYKWTLIGGNPNTALIKEPTVSYTDAGSYFLLLEASNGKTTRNQQQEIKLAPDKGFRIFSNIKLGISSAKDSTHGSYFSTTLGKQWAATSKIADTEAPLIDIVFFGLDSKLSYMQFVTPNQATSVGFNAIKSATATKFLNQQILMDSTAFGQITRQRLIDLPITRTIDIAKSVNTKLPQVILFENARSKKGAILVKQIVSNGSESYVLVDIKVMK